MLEWRGEQCALAWGGVLPLSGRITLQVRRSATAIAAFVEPDDIVLPVDGIPLRLHDAFATAVDGTDGWGRTRGRRSGRRRFGHALRRQLPAAAADLRMRQAAHLDLAMPLMPSLSAAAWLRSITRPSLERPAVVDAHHHPRRFFGLRTTA